MRTIAALLVLTLAAGLYAGCRPADAATQGLSMAIPVVSTAPPIDGTLASPIWSQAVKVTMPFDRMTHSASQEKTDAYLLTDGKALFIAFDAQQTRTPILANQHNNNTGVDTDDEVKLQLWPGGKNGVNYTFISTPIGTRYQYSSENLSYEPTWEAAGHVDGTEYIVTMRVPLSCMHGADPRKWLINLTRFEATTGSLYAWSGGADFQGTNDPNYAMPLVGMPKTAAVRPQPRAGVYGLGSLASPTIGGNTSRVGADFSIPITDGTSFIAALHPDFSNVEQDQQSISPTAFRRYISETRPFFTQGANYYNYMECDACPNEFSLYTPDIPTPRDGYAIEGKQGPLTFAGFDAVGDTRNDNAQSVTFRNDPQTLFVSAQRVSVTMDPSFRDDTLQYAGKWSDLKHKFIYANYGTESATSNWITDPNQARFEEIGAGYYGPNSFFGGGVRNIGAQYNPYDGFVTHPSDSTGNLGLSGYGFFDQRIWAPRGSVFKQITLSGFIDRYHGVPGLDQSDSNLNLDMVTRNLWELSINTGSSYLWSNLQDPNNPSAPAQDLMVPVTQESTSITYHSGLATPSKFTFARGRYGFGELDSFFRSTTFRLGSRGLVTLEADDTRQYLDNNTANIQWLERVSYALQIDANTSLAVGVRRFFGPPPAPNGGSVCTVPTASNPNALGYCPNISFALHKRLPHDELYVIYGDASETFTVPQFLVKVIHYFGAEKGT